jgi:hypothetical protein
MSAVKNTVRTCHNCVFFFVTHEAQKPWGCRHFGFKSANIPAQAVFQASGTNCAYKQVKALPRQQKKDLG